jgi:hypothetical protein
LGNIQKVKDGEPLGNRAAPESDFAPVTDGDSGAKPATANDIFS